MKMPVEISFGASSSVQYARAVRFAASLPGYRQTGQGKDVLHEVVLELSLDDRPLWSRLERLVAMIQSWKSAMVELAGRPNAWAEWSGSLAQVRRCHEAKRRSGAGDEYCSPGETASDFF